MLRLSGNRGAAAPRLPGLRGEAGEAEVPLPGGSLRVHLCRSAGTQAGAYGRIVRIALADQDRWIFTPTPHSSPSWKRGYRRRSTLERIYSRLDNDFGFERHFLRGRSRVTARVGLALTVMMALAQARAGRRQRMRSLVGAVPYAHTG